MSEGVVMRCLGASVMVDAYGNKAPVGLWLKGYWPERHDGLGDSEFTAELSEAMVFPDAIAAFETYRRVPVNRPRRADGRPNRPLTALTMEFLTLEQARELGDV